VTCLPTTPNPVNAPPFHSSRTPCFRASLARQTATDGSPGPSSPLSLMSTATYRAAGLRVACFRARRTSSRKVLIRLRNGFVQPWRCSCIVLLGQSSRSAVCAMHRAAIAEAAAFIQRARESGEPGAWHTRMRARCRVHMLMAAAACGRRDTSVHTCTMPGCVCSRVAADSSWRCSLWLGPLAMVPVPIDTARASGHTIWIGMRESNRYRAL
jgi:hypothetical protein